MLTIVDHGPLISADQISALENSLNAKISDEYRRFLIRNNGGTPEPDVIDVAGAPGTPTDVQVFFGIGREVASSDLAWNLALISSRCPGQHLLPIACDSGGNLFCLKIEHGQASRVVYCDLDDPDCRLYQVSSGFDEFVASIRQYV